MTIPSYYYSAVGSELLYLAAPADWREFVVWLDHSEPRATICAHFFRAIGEAYSSARASGALVAEAQHASATHLVVAGPDDVIGEFVSLIRDLHASTSGRLVFGKPPEGRSYAEFSIGIPAGWKVAQLDTGNNSDRDIRRLMKRVKAGASQTVCVRGGSKKALIGPEAQVRLVGERMRSMGLAGPLKPTPKQ